MSLPNFIIEQTFTDKKTHQSVWSDGVHIWSINAGNASLLSGIYKYDMEGTLVASNPDATSDIVDRESDVYQLCGFDVKDGKLYVGHHNYPNGSDDPGHGSLGGLYAKSWIVRYDAVTLEYETKWPVGDRTVVGADSVAKWTEGCAWHEGSQRFFVVFHGDAVLEEYSLDENGDFVFEARHTLSGIDQSNETYNAFGFEDITFAGDYAYMNRHAATGDPYFYQFKWTGSGFEFVQKFPRLGTNFTQGINIQPGTNILWCCERTSGTDGELGDISKVRVVGFDLLELHNGVMTSFEDTGVQYTDSNGVIISK